MKKNLLGLALLGAMSLSQAATAQEYDNRWYISGTAGILFADSDRFDADDSGLYGIGFGKRFMPNFGMELSMDWASPAIYEAYYGGASEEWSLTSIFLDGRYYFNKEGRNWDPYLVGGIGATEHEIAEFDGTEIAFKAGVGIESDRRKRVDFRLEAGWRYDGHEEKFLESTAQGFEIGPFSDYYFSGSLLVKLGDLPVPVVAAATCDTMDSDGDGVNDCNDKCPGSAAGQTIGADGCPVKLTIDLKGVNFDFDKDTLRPDAVVILDEAVAVLAKYPELRVEVAGHTDSKGKDDYNQNLSERRAKTVYDYLTSKGIDASRLVGPNGYGEARPIDTNETDEGRANNRRTELNVQN